MKLNKLNLSILSAIAAMLLVTSLALNTKTSEAQQQASRCPPQSYTCSFEETAKNCFQQTAKSVAKAQCQKKLDDCQQSKAEECVRYCLTRSCFGGTIDLGDDACSEADCKTESKTSSDGFSLPLPGGCSASHNEGRSVTVYTCKSNVENKVKCVCDENETGD